MLFDTDLVLFVGDSPSICVRQNYKGMMYDQLSYTLCDIVHTKYRSLHGFVI